MSRQIGLAVVALQLPRTTEESNLPPPAAPRRGLSVARKLLAALLLLTIHLACASLRTITRPNALVIVTIDTVRADHLGAYGATAGRTPALDRLAAEGVVFEDATSVAPLTLPAHCSLFTGLLPPRHGVRDNADPPLDSSYETLAETLHRNGFRTAAFVSSVVLRGDRGLAQGFDLYGDAGARNVSGRPGLQRPANEVMDEALAWLSGRGDAPYFTWIHLYDAHAPYEPPSPYGEMYPGDPYAGEIAFVDSQIARLMDALDGLQLSDRTVVIVAGDHGESLGDHGEAGHGIFVYESVLRVPLIARVPRMAARRIPGVARLIDIAPTALELLGHGAPKVDGVSLVPLMSGTATSLDLEAYSESLYPERFGLSPLRALHDGRYKLIEAPRSELYDLQSDPLEQHNLYEGRRALAAALAARLSTFGNGNGREDGARATHQVGRETRERLAAIGYVSGPERHERARDIRSRADPKDHIARFSCLTRGC